MILEKKISKMQTIKSSLSEAQYFAFFGITAGTNIIDIFCSAVPAFIINRHDNICVTCNIISLPGRLHFTHECPICFINPNCNLNTH